MFVKPQAMENQKEIIEAIIRAAEITISQVVNMDVRLIMRTEAEPRGTVEEMLAVVAQALGMTMDDYYEGRKREYVDLRCLAAVFIHRYYSHLPMKRTGTLLGKMDHTTIINYRQRAKQYLYIQDEQFCKKYNDTLKAVKAWIGTR